MEGRAMLAIALPSFHGPYGGREILDDGI